MIDSKVLIEKCDEVIEDILDDLEIDFVRENEWLSMPCMFHGGVKNNLKYKNLKFYCFSECHRSYTIVDVVKKQLSLNYSDAVKWLKNKVKLEDSAIDITQEKIEARNRMKLLDTLIKSKKKKKHKDIEPVSGIILNDIIDYHHPYILEQGFKDETLSYFNIGFGIDGAVKDRITFPIDSPDGQILSVSGRSIDGSEPRYRIIGDTKKTLTLFNYSRAKNEVIKYGFVILVEGFKSVMKLHEWGYKNAVACMGSSVSEEQVTLLLKLGVKIVVCGDNDDAGKILNQKVYNKCYKFVEVIKLPMERYSDVEKDSIADLDDEAMFDLVDDLEEI
nr:MAG TPA: DNA primase, catalytic core [Caudoviricetes sp.]